MNPSYWAVIHADVRYSNIKPSAKLLYGELSCLTNKTGYCFATNTYFAELYNVSKNTISLWIKDLKNAGFISVDIIHGNNREVIERRIAIIKNRGITKNDDTPIIKNVEDNKTSINNTSNNINIRKFNFESEVKLLDFDYNTKIDFINYWTEPNRSNTKMKFELEKTWETKRRLARWVKMSNKTYNKNYKKVNKIEKHLQTHNEALQIIEKLDNDKKIQ